MILVFRGGGPSRSATGFVRSMTTQTNASHVRQAFLLPARIRLDVFSAGPRVWRWAAGASHHPETRAGSLLVWWFSDS